MSNDAGASSSGTWRALLADAPSYLRSSSYFGTKLAPPKLQTHQEPSSNYLLVFVVAIFLGSVAVFGGYKSLERPKRLLRFCGVSLRKVRGSMREIERKGFHIAGLLVPLIHTLMLRGGFSNMECTKLCCTITALGWCADLARLRVRFIARHWPGRGILREFEHTQLTGGCYFSLGCTTAIAMSPPSVAMASILFLVLGDMSAAIIGVSFGGDALGKHRLGREGKKSLEGSVAMFGVCFVVGAAIFGEIKLREYPVFFGALAATLVELYEPLGLNDNLTIPVVSSMAMQLAFRRIQSC